jgi:hypothetical protein
MAHLLSCRPAHPTIVADQGHIDGCIYNDCLGNVMSNALRKMCHLYYTHVHGVTDQLADIQQTIYLSKFRSTFDPFDYENRDLHIFIA